MKKNFLGIMSLLLAVILVSGCATTRPKPMTAQDPQAQIADLQSQVQAKDQEIQDLRYQLESHQQSLSNNFSSSGDSDKYNLLRVPGVTATDVQRALVRAGFDPGPVDGRLGRQTKKAIKAFQRKNGLTADGVIGDKTWAALRSN